MSMNRCTKAHAVVLIDSREQSCSVFTDIVEPYFRQFGICYDIRDISAPLAELYPLEQWPLIVLGHYACLRHADDGQRAEIIDAVRAGSGLVSFGEALEPWAAEAVGPCRTSTLIAIDAIDHPISELHQYGERRRHYSLFQSLSPRVRPLGDGRVLARLGEEPLVSAFEDDRGRAVFWGTVEWADPEILGPMYGLDDLIWRSALWSAAKPFVMRSVPPFVTMRIDDVSGFGRQRGGPSGLYWLEDCVELGWKPWVGLFLDDLDSSSIAQLRTMLQDGSVTACPHAFSYYDFIYYKHTEADGSGGGYRPLTAEEAGTNITRVDAWYATNPGIPISKVFLAHFYELSEVCLPALVRWGCEFICSMNPLDAPFTRRLHGKPYFSKKRPRTDQSPIFYADFMPVSQQQYKDAFFACVTEIRDDRGYEWAPDNDVDKSIQCGINQLSRALDGKVLAQLFTHESDFVRHIMPDRWKAIIRGITDYYRGQNVRYVTLDKAMFYLRDLNRSQCTDTMLADDGSIVLRLDGVTSGETEVAIYRESRRLEPEWHRVPPFSGSCRVVIPNTTS